MLCDCFAFYLLCVPCSWYARLAGFCVRTSSEAANTLKDVINGVANKNGQGYEQVRG